LRSPPRSAGRACVPRLANAGPEQVSERWPRHDLLVRRGARTRATASVSVQVPT